MTRLLKLDRRAVWAAGGGNIPQGRPILEKQTATALTVYRHKELTPTLFDHCLYQPTSKSNRYSSPAYEGKQSPIRMD